MIFIHFMFSYDNIPGPYQYIPECYNSVVRSFLLHNPPHRSAEPG